MPKKQDLTGKVFGRLTVLKEADKEHKKKRGVTWICQCSCQNKTIIYATTGDLNSGNTTSCGCIRKEKLIKRNLLNGTVHIGNKYGKLTVIKDLGLKQQLSRDKRWRWSLCKCECGNQIEVPNNLLQNGQKKSCGCINKSYGEELIENLLKNNNIPFKKEYSFSDLFNKKTNAKLRFDFAIFDNFNNLLYLIEFDGKQHYKNTRWNNNPKSESFSERKERDDLKNEYCIKNKIPLIRIDYSHYKDLSIDDLKLESTKYLINLPKKS